MRIFLFEPGHRLFPTMSWRHSCRSACRELRRAAFAELGLCPLRPAGEEVKQGLSRPSPAPDLAGLTISAEARADGSPGRGNRTRHELPGEAGKREKTLMFSLRWFGSRGLVRGKPGVPLGHGRRLVVLGLLAAASLLQTGCQSGPFSPCGFVGRTTSRIMRPFRHSSSSASCCGAEAVPESGCVSSGVPIEAMGSPIVTPGPIISPGSSTPSNVLSPDTQLDAIPQASPGPAPSGAIRKVPSGSASKTSSNYETQRPDYPSGRARGENLAHTLITNPAPTSRSAQDLSQTASRARAQGADSDLDHLPPLDLPREVTEKNVTPPVAPAADRERKNQNPTQASPAASDHLSSRSPRVPDSSTTTNSNPTPSAQPAPDPAPVAAGTPGIARFAVVDLKIAGGSAPSTAGLDWLAERGYKTLVDLRESSEANAAFIAQAAQRGFRYIALPVTARTIDRDHLGRFNFELASSDARPLYFFDGDGTRAGALWYLRRITLDHIDRQVARREAEELGLNSQEYWLAATNYLESLDRPRSSASPSAQPAAMTAPAGTLSPQASIESGQSLGTGATMVLSSPSVGCAKVSDRA